MKKGVFLKIIVISILLIIASPIILSSLQLQNLKKNPTDLIENREISKELKERIGQMIIIGFKETKILNDSYIVKVIRDVKVGGVILFQRNTLTPNQTKKLISDLQFYSKTPLFITTTVEGGKISHVKYFHFLSFKELGEIGDYKITKKEALKLSQKLKELGFNMNLAPVVDLDINPKNPIIGGLGRAFSANPEEVVLHAQAFIEAHHQNNIITVAKHFPGHGSSTKDTHLGLVDVTDVYKEEELIPYKLLQKKGLLDVVMTAHITNRKIDNYPATLSSPLLINILREQIGFKGVIISDDMQMGAITKYYKREEAIIKAINSGCDILLFSNNSTREKYDKNLAYKIQEIICQAVRNGEIPEERIWKASNRIYELKRLFKIIK